MKYIIMCGGKYSRWKTPRQLLKIQGEPIVARTIRLLKSEGVRDIAISTNDSRFAGFGVPILKHKNNMKVDTSKHVTGAWVEAFFPMDEPACYLMGDVVFSQAAIRTIVQTETDSIRFFASVPPFSPLYIKEWGEPFAFKVADQRRFRAAIDFVAANVDTGIFCRHPIAWELWQVINGKDVQEIDDREINVINDFTCDVDCPADIEKIEAVLCEL